MSITCPIKQLRNYPQIRRQDLSSYLSKRKKYSLWHRMNIGPGKKSATYDKIQLEEAYMAEKKQIALAILEILKKHSDEDHILSFKQISSYLDQEYSITIERRTLYANIYMLKEFGYEISGFDENGKGYYLSKRQFDKAEVLLLCNAIHASHFISSKQSDDLIAKLLKTQSSYQAKEFSDKVYMPNPLKTQNKQLLYTIANVSEAIRDNKKLSFTYLRYDQNKRLTPRRKQPYIVEPRYIVYADSRAYMIVTSDNHPGFIHYRLDRIKDAKVLNEPSSVLRNKEDAYEYARNKLFMYAGHSGMVTFRCKESVLDQMIDLFGPETSILSQADGTFLINVRTTDTGAIFLAQQYMDAIELLKPEELRDRFLNILKEAYDRYQKQTA